MVNHEPHKVLVYVGTYTTGKSEGIYVCSLDRAKGALRIISVTKGIRNPSFLAIHPSRRYLYAVSEVEDAGGKGYILIKGTRIGKNQGQVSRITAAGIFVQEKVEGADGKMKTREVPLRLYADQ